jgi:hypothetical protein
MTKVSNYLSSDIGRDRIGLSLIFGYRARLRLLVRVGLMCVNGTAKVSKGLQRRIGRADLFRFEELTFIVEGRKGT